MGQLSIHKTDNIFLKDFFSMVGESVTTLTKKTTEYVISFLGMIKSTCCFPMRYVGAKTWSIPGIIIRTPYVIFKRTFGISTQKSFKEELFGTGYSYRYELLGKEEVKSMLLYASSIACGHSIKPEWIEPFGFQIISPKTLGIQFPNIEAREHCFFDPKTSLKVVIIEKDNEVVISFGALRCGDSEVSEEIDRTRMFRIGLRSAVYNWVGGIPEIYMEAEMLLKEILNHSRFKGKKIVLAGQCFGGSLAGFIALKNKIPAYCFNTLPFGAGLQQEIGDENLACADQYLTHLKIENDFLNNRHMYRIGDRILTGLGIRTPGCFGRKFFIPSAYQKGKEIHEFYIGSMMQYLGFDKRSKSKDVVHLLFPKEEPKIPAKNSFWNYFSLVPPILSTIFSKG